MSESERDRKADLLKRVRQLNAETIDEADTTATKEGRPAPKGVDLNDDAVALIKRLDAASTRLERVVGDIGKTGAQPLTAALTDKKILESMADHVAEAASAKITAVVQRDFRPLSADVTRDIARLVAAARRWSWESLLAVVIACVGGIAIGFAGAYWWGYHDGITARASMHATPRVRQP